MLWIVALSALISPKASWNHLQLATALEDPTGLLHALSAANPLVKQCKPNPFIYIYIWFCMCILKPRAKAIRVRRCPCFEVVGPVTLISCREISSILVLYSFYTHLCWPRNLHWLLDPHLKGITFERKGLVYHKALSKSDFHLSGGFYVHRFSLMWHDYRNWHSTTADLSKDLRFAIRGLECYAYQIGTMGNLRMPFRKSWSHELTTSTTLTELISLRCRNRPC